MSRIQRVEVRGVDLDPHTLARAGGIGRRACAVDAAAAGHEPVTPPGAR
jgi:hypothetical protein